jgi:glycosyltransferase involved in cell wall biosynthesis
MPNPTNEMTPILRAAQQAEPAMRISPRNVYSARKTLKRRRRTESDLNYPIIVHSHLGWDWVWQRPQQFLSRLSRWHRVLFIEGPVPVAELDASRVTLREVGDFPNVVVLETHIPNGRWHDGDWVDNERRRIVKSALAGPLRAEFERPVQWFYDPMAVTAFAGHMNERAIVFDCMDELSKFRYAQPELVRRERELLTLADVVFAGGPKIGEAKRVYNPNCFAYGCGVDVDHFGRARDAEMSVPDDVAQLEKPVLGYFGVVDERMDYELLARVADAHPEWNLVIIGPHTKVDPATFPRYANIHWLGKRDYGQLPAYAKPFDVCLMPFAINETTEYINPTKALEYMATGRAVVSTEIDDVVAQFGAVVKIARSHDEFITHCERAISRPDRAAIRRGLALARRNSWEGIVRKLEGHIADVLELKERLATSAA